MKRSTGFIIGLFLLAIVVAAWNEYNAYEARKRKQAMKEDRIWDFQNGWCDEKVKVFKDWYIETMTKLLNHPDNTWHGIVAAVHAAAQKGDVWMDPDKIRNENLSALDPPIKEAREELRKLHQVPPGNAEEIIRIYKNSDAFKEQLRREAEGAAKWYYNSGSDEGENKDLVDGTAADDPDWLNTWKKHLENNPGLRADGCKKKQYASILELAS